jgi:hypothetical protein
MPIVNPDIFIQSQILSETGNTESASEFLESIADNSQLKDFISQILDTLNCTEQHNCSSWPSIFDFILTNLPDQLETALKRAQAEHDQLVTDLKQALACEAELHKKNSALKQALAKQAKLETALK